MAQIGRLDCTHENDDDTQSYTCGNTGKGKGRERALFRRLRWAAGMTERESKQPE